ncbi:MAG: hypothetical protein WC148_04585 [Bacilli bacterium]
MIGTVLFVTSAVCTINFAIKMVGAVAGSDITMPVPLLHKVGISFANVYISTPALAYQIWFWSVHYGVI